MNENKKPQTTHGSEQNEVLKGHWNKSHLKITIVHQSDV